MIKIITSAEDLRQAKDLVDLGVDQVIVGEEVFGLRIPGYFSLEEMAELIAYARPRQTQVVVAANAILHNDKIHQAREFLKEVKAIGPDYLLVGDTGLIQILKDEAYKMPYIYDAATLVTSPGTINFWAKYGAQASFVANEVPLYELGPLVDRAEIPVIYQVYGAMCIHQSKRHLLENYFRHIQQEPANFADRHHFIRLPNKNKQHQKYSIYEDSHGTHVFADVDLDLLPYLDRLVAIDAKQWYLEGLYCPGDRYLAIVEVFIRAKEALEAGTWTAELLADLQADLLAAHPQERMLGTGFFLHEEGMVK